MSPWHHDFSVPHEVPAAASRWTCRLFDSYHHVTGQWEHISGLKIYNMDPANMEIPVVTKQSKHNGKKMVSFCLFGKARCHVGSRISHNFSSFGVSFSQLGTPRILLFIWGGPLLFRASSIVATLVEGHYTQICASGRFFWLDSGLLIGGHCHGEHFWFYIYR